MNEKLKTKVIYGLILCFGFMCAGFFPGYYYFKTYKTNNSVTVKGLSEMDVKADMAVWNLKFTVADNIISNAQRKVNSNIEAIKKYLIGVGFEESAINLENLLVVDKLADRYTDNSAAKYRYILTQKIVVKSDDVDLVSKSVSGISSLVSKGIVFDGNDYTSPVTYLFTKLNDVKPEMLEKSIKNAAASADEFAKASGASLGKIKKASQGIFSILPQDGVGSEREFINKKIRVVSTVEYWLD